MRATAACILLAALSGCLVPPGDAAPSAAASPWAGSRPIVVAVLDTGVNPYHVAFAAPAGAVGWPQVASTPVALTTAGDDWGSRVDADKAVWDAIQPETLYRFEGTRLMAISFGSDTRGPLVLDGDGHGTGTSSVLARDGPHVVIVLVQADLRVCLGNTSCLVDSSVARAMAWAAEQPWIDVISMSLAFPANVPDSALLHPEAARFVAASRAAWESGKLVVACAGNEPTATLTDYIDGPPWVISVGGAQASEGGETTKASRGVDVAANYSMLVASHRSLDAMVVERGTSFGTPTVSATLAEALRIATSLPDDKVQRRDALRAALNATAVPFGPTDWKPTPPELTYSSLSAITNPVLLQGPQHGWGFIDASMAPRVAELASGASAPQSDPASPRALWQDRWQAARVAYWGSGAGPGS